MHHSDFRYYYLQAKFNKHLKVVLFNESINICKRYLKMTLAKETSFVPGAESIRWTAAACEARIVSGNFEKPQNVFNCTAMGWPG